ncbi:MAG TPA: hypothetical protein DD000_13750 [Cyanobacteria bacterium UBA11166]|nr:hypothetical protein [Cyanobacteria bacterium UBA11166]
MNIETYLSFEVLSFEFCLSTSLPEGRAGFEGRLSPILPMLFTKPAPRQFSPIPTENLTERSP